MEAALKRGRHRGRRRCRPLDREVVVAFKEAHVYGFDCTCHYCGAFCHARLHGPHRAIADHLVPVSRGGADAEENLVVACGACDFLKGKMLASEYLASEAFALVQRLGRDAAWNELRGGPHRRLPIPEGELLRFLATGPAFLGTVANSFNRAPSMVLHQLRLLERAGKLRRLHPGRDRRDTAWGLPTTHEVLQDDGRSEGEAA